MIRASSASRICTNRPTFSQEDLDKSFETLKKKVGDDFHIENLETYMTTRGIMTVAKDVKKELEKKHLFDTDPLPDGAKSYLQERWLELNYGFVDVSSMEGSFATMKGNIVEDDAISMTAGYYDLSFKKNTERITKGFMSGECDVIYTKDGIRIIRDNKSPETWRTFRAKKGISIDYYWQLIAYCYLYDAQAAFLDYTLMPTPSEIVHMITRNLSDINAGKFYDMEDKIINLPTSQRIKTYNVDSFSIISDLEFLKSRLQKAEKYYNTLTYEQCMSIN